ncbi:MAG: PBP1A family penicillin-binding protein [Syntrophorhabdales bacterium]|jgi:penicillin-binding protein 1A
MSRIIKLTAIIFFLPAALGVAFGYSLVNYLEIPDVKDLAHYGPKSATRLYADDGALFAELFVEKRIPIPLKDMPDHLRKAFIAIEDVRFYEHSGFDLRGIGRAIYKNLVRQGMSEGASTITQQLARNLFLTPTKSMKRKIEELILAINIERNYSKDEILNMYLNLIYLGEGAYGVEAASYTYFDKKAKELSVAEAATLAGLTKSPSRSSPFKNQARTLERRNLVLRKMREAGFITETQYRTASREPLVLAPFRIHEKKTGFFIEQTKQSLEEFLPQQDQIFTNGLNVRTTINLKMTEYAYSAIDKGMKLYRERNPKVEVLPEVALIAMEVKTGEIKVLIGGKDFTNSPYNRATQAKRQPGSAFKPFIYLAALCQGYRPDIRLLDAPVSYAGSTGQAWQPRNYNNEYHGSVTMRRALELSLNSATVRLLDRVGVSNVVRLAKDFHINSNFSPNLSLALGSTEVCPLELAAAYAAIARGGAYIPPVTIRNILTAQGEELHQDALEERVVSPDAASMLVDMMKGVIKRGTAAKASGMPYALAGKTGTTNDFRDAWFVGFSPQLLCLVWVGYDKDTYLGKRESGGTTALPIWMEFMAKALPAYPKEDFQVPQKETVTRYVYPPEEDSGAPAPNGAASSSGSAPGRENPLPPAPPASPAQKPPVGPPAPGRTNDGGLF